MVLAFQNECNLIRLFRDVARSSGSKNRDHLKSVQGNLLHFAVLLVIRTSAAINASANIKLNVISRSQKTRNMGIRPSQRDWWWRVSNSLCGVPQKFRLTVMSNTRLPFMDYVFVNEIQGRSELGSFCLGTHTLQDSLMMMRYGTDEMKKTYLHRLVQAEIGPSFAMTVRDQL